LLLFENFILETMSPARLPFTVASCSSEEDGFSSSELLNPGPTCRGWRSAQYCIYPQVSTEIQLSSSSDSQLNPILQEIVLQLDSRSTVERIQLLMHATMVSSSVELHLGDTPDSSANLKKAMFLKLGEVAWASNKAETNYAGRFLKSPKNLEIGRLSSIGRQLQTIELDRGLRGLFLKLVLKGNHITRKNEYNQISLMGVNVLGSQAPSGFTDLGSVMKR
jgi:hypothetical protein